MEVLKMNSVRVVRRVIQVNTEADRHTITRRVAIIAVAEILPIAKGNPTVTTMKGASRASAITMHSSLSALKTLVAAEMNEAEDRAPMLTPTTTVQEDEGLVDMAMAAVSEDIHTTTASPPTTSTVVLPTCTVNPTDRHPGLLRTTGHHMRSP